MRTLIAAIMAILFVCMPVNAYSQDSTEPMVEAEASVEGQVVGKKFRPLRATFKFFAENWDPETETFMGQPRRYSGQWYPQRCDPYPATRPPSGDYTTRDWIARGSRMFSPDDLPDTYACRHYVERTSYSYLRAPNYDPNHERRSLREHLRRLFRPKRVAEEAEARLEEEEVAE